MKTFQSAVQECQRGLKEQYVWCNACRKERREMEAQLLTLINGLGKRVDGFNRAMGEFVTKATALLSRKPANGQ